MKSELLDLEDDLSRLRSQLTLLQMASGDLLKEQRDALYLGLDQALERAADIGERLRALREDADA